MNDKKYGVSRMLPAAAILFAALLLAVLMPLRLWQQINLVEPGTGFWSGSNATIPLLYAGLGVLAIVPMAAALFLRKRAAMDLSRRRRLFEGITAALAAAALVWDAVMAFRFAISLFDGSGGGLDGESSSQAVYYIRSGALACVLESLFGLLGAVFFGQLAALDVLPNKKIYAGRALALAPFAWTVCRVLRRFSRTISYLRVSDLFLSLALLVALMLFLLAFAQNLNSRHSGTKAASLAAAGIPAAVLALLCFVPRFVSYNILGAEAPQDALTEWCDPTMALFILTYIGGRLFTGAPMEKIQLEEEPEEEALAKEAPAEEVPALEEEIEEQPEEQPEE